MCSALFLLQVFLYVNIIFPFDIFGVYCIISSLHLDNLRDFFEKFEELGWLSEYPAYRHSH